jgi:hypothetical protein
VPSCVSGWADRIRKCTHKRKGGNGRVFKGLAELEREELHSDVWSFESLGGSKFYFLHAFNHLGPKDMVLLGMVIGQMVIISP